MNRHLDTLEKDEAELSADILALYKELSDGLDVEMESFFDVNGIQHIRISNCLDIVNPWERCLRQGEEFPLELFIEDTIEYKEDYIVKLFAGYAADVEDDTWTVDFQNGEEFSDWLTAAKESSLFSSSATPTSNDKIITLSTCSYEFYNARFVVHGVLNMP